MCNPTFSEVHSRRWTCPSQCCPQSKPTFFFKLELKSKQFYNFFNEDHWETLHLPYKCLGKCRYPTLEFGCPMTFFSWLVSSPRMCVEIAYARSLGFKMYRELVSFRKTNHSNPFQTLTDSFWNNNTWKMSRRSVRIWVSMARLLSISSVPRSRLSFWIMWKMSTFSHRHPMSNCTIRHGVDGPFRDWTISTSMSFRILLMICLWMHVISRCCLATILTYPFSSHGHLTSSPWMRAKQFGLPIWTSSIFSAAASSKALNCRVLHLTSVMCETLNPMLRFLASWCESCQTFLNWVSHAATGVRNWVVCSKTISKSGRKFKALIWMTIRQCCNGTLLWNVSRPEASSTTGASSCFENLNPGLSNILKWIWWMIA